MSDPVETRGPEIPESVYKKAVQATALSGNLGYGTEGMARAAVDAAVVELGLTVERRCLRAVIAPPDYDEGGKTARRAMKRIGKLLAESDGRTE